jgi:hypothetical protein
MEKNNPNNKFLYSFCALLIIVSTLLVLVLIDNNKALQRQVDLRDTLIRNIQLHDSLLLAQNQKTQSSINKYIYDCNIVIDGRKVSTNELIQLLTNQINQLQINNDSIRLLNAVLLNYYDSLSIYKSFYTLAKKQFKTDFTIQQSGKYRTIAISIPSDSTLLFKRLYEIAQRDYGIKYKIETRKDFISITKIFSKADSALLIYQYYKDKLKVDSSGQWTIETPSKIKNQKRK